MSINKIIEQRREQFHLARVGENLSPLDPHVRAFIDAGKAYVMHHTGDPARSEQMTLRSLADLRQQQAASLAYFDVFWLFAVLCPGLVLFVPPTRRSVAEKGELIGASRPSTGVDPGGRSSRPPRNDPDCPGNPGTPVAASRVAVAFESFAIRPGWVILLVLSKPAAGVVRRRTFPEGNEHPMAHDDRPGRRGDRDGCMGLGEAPRTGIGGHGPAACDLARMAEVRSHGVRRSLDGERGPTPATAGRFATAPGLELAPRALRVRDAKPTAG